jgi:hypothetical protein
MIAVGTGIATAQHGPATMGRNVTAPLTGLNDALPTAAQGVMPFASNTTPLTNAMTHGLTSPIPAPGGGVDTLGGIRGDLSQGLRPPSKPKTNMFAMGVGLIGVAGGLVYFATTFRGGSAKDEPLPIVQPAKDPPVAPVVAKTEENVPPPAKEEPVPVQEDKAAAADPTPSTTSKQTRRDPKPAREEPAPAPSRKVKLAFESDPPGAMVFVDGKQMGMTPIYGSEFAKDETLTFVFKLAGHEDETMVVPATMDRTVKAKLSKLAGEPEKVAPPGPRREPDPLPVEAKREKPEKKEKKPPADPSLLDDKVDDLKE